MNLKHRMTETLEFKTWAGMRYRCESETNKDYHKYGARGIKVCDEWHQFERFYADMGPKPAGKTLDRIDNNGPYCKANCRWATHSEQNRNKRNSVTVEYNGERTFLIDLASRIGMNYTTLYSRIVRGGWSLERALSTPLRGA